MQATREPGKGMYGFLLCTVEQYMTPTVVTVNRQMTMRELGALFEQHDFNALPVVEDDKILGNRQQVRLFARFRLHQQSNATSL